MSDLSPNISIITLNANGPNKPIRRQRLANRIKKYDPTTHYLQETHFKYNDIHGLKVKGREYTYYANIKENRSGYINII